MRHKFISIILALTLLAQGACFQSSAVSYQPGNTLRPRALRERGASVEERIEHIKDMISNMRNVINPPMRNVIGPPQNLDVNAVRSDIATINQDIALLEELIGDKRIIKILRNALHTVVFATVRKKVFSIWANATLDEIKARLGFILDASKLKAEDIAKNEEALKVAEFVFSHTAVNAFDAVVQRDIAFVRQAGTGVVSVEAYIDSGRLVIELRDRGIGVPPNLMNSLFFFEIDSHKLSEHYFGQYGTALFNIAKRIDSFPGAEIEISSRKDSSAPILKKSFRSHRDKNVWLQFKPLRERIWPPRPRDTFWTRIRIAVPIIARKDSDKKIQVSQPSWSLYEDGDRALAQFGMDSSRRPDVNYGWENIILDRQTDREIAINI